MPIQDQAHVDIEVEQLKPWSTPRVVASELYQTESGGLSLVEDLSVLGNLTS